MQPKEECGEVWDHGNMREPKGQEQGQPAGPHGQAAGLPVGHGREQQGIPYGQQMGNQWKSDNEQKLAWLEEGQETERESEAARWTILEHASDQGTCKSWPTNSTTSCSTISKCPRRSTSSAMCQ